MTALGKRISLLESRFASNTPPKPIVFLIAGQFDPSAVPTNQHVVIFEIITPSGVKK